MNEQTKKYLLYGVGVLLCIVAGWFLFRNIHGDIGSADRTTNELNNVAAEQRDVGKSLGEIKSGLDDSIGTAGQLGQSNRESQSIADRISESNRNAGSAAANIKQSNSNAYESIKSAQSKNDAGASIARSSEQIFSRSISILQDIRETAGKD